MRLKPPLKMSYKETYPPQMPPGSQFNPYQPNPPPYYPEQSMHQGGYYPGQPMVPYPGAQGMEMGIPIAHPAMMQGGTQVMEVDQRRHHDRHKEDSRDKKIEKLKKKYENKGFLHYNKPCLYGMICGFFCGTSTLLGSSFTPSKNQWLRISQRETWRNQLNLGLVKDAIYFGCLAELKEKC